ncbi:MAG: DUF1343 domain-containing protein [Clostridia bacterium]|nr:DUF1343 domain-containing protein [Clostridia bacterium]
MKQTVFNACDLLDTLQANSLLSGKRLGLLTNVSGVTRDLQKTSVCLSQMYHLCALFSPEHGLSGVQQAGGFDSDVFVDPQTGAPVYDLYGNKDGFQTAQKALQDLDMLLFDIQDIGIRYYTYQHTMLDAMKLCADVGIPFVVLDRVNPLGGVSVQGSCMEDDCLSDVGSVPGQPVVSGMTVGELALWYKDLFCPGLQVHILHCKGWKREYTFDNTDLLFVPPSPNMPTMETVFLYSGTCLFEDTNISEGRGTTKPFEQFGAPWLNTEKVISVLCDLPEDARKNFDGLVFRPCEFMPTFSDYTGEVCKGMQLHIRDKQNVNMYATVLYLFDVMRKVHPEEFTLDSNLPLLAGTKRILADDFNVSAFLEEQAEKCKEFAKMRKQYLLY